MSGRANWLMAAILLLLAIESEARDTWSWQGLSFCESSEADTIELFGNTTNDSYHVFVYTYDQLERPFAGIDKNYSRAEFHFSNVGGQVDEYYLYKIWFGYDDGFPFWDLQSLAVSLTTNWFGADAIIDKNDHEGFRSRPRWSPVAATSIGMGGEHGGIGGFGITVTDCGRQDASASGFK